MHSFRNYLGQVVIMCFLGFIIILISQREKLVTDTSSYFRAMRRPIFRNYVQILSMMSRVGMHLRVTPFFNGRTTFGALSR